MGKVLIQITDTEGPLLRSGPPPAEPTPAGEPDPAPAAEEGDPPVKAVFTARRDRSYIITGGLGGFGLALAAWLAGKGAGHLVLTSKRCALTQVSHGEPRKFMHAQWSNVSAGDGMTLKLNLDALPGAANAQPRYKTPLPPWLPLNKP